jgi:hypothetical protein
MRCILALPLCTLFSLAILPASDAQVAVAHIDNNLSLTVPSVCQAQINGASYEAQSQSISYEVREMCNSGGYALLLKYEPAELSDKFVRYAGVIIQLDNSGLVELAASPYPVSRRETIEVFPTVSGTIPGVELIIQR